MGHSKIIEREILILLKGICLSWYNQLTSTFPDVEDQVKLKLFLSKAYFTPKLARQDKEKFTLY